VFYFDSQCRKVHAEKWPAIKQLNSCLVAKLSSPNRYGMIRHCLFLCLWDRLSGHCCTAYPPVVTDQTMPIASQCQHGSSKSVWYCLHLTSLELSMYRCPQVSFHTVGTWKHAAVTALLKDRTGQPLRPTSVQFLICPSYPRYWRECTSTNIRLSVRAQFISSIPVCLQEVSFHWDGTFEGFLWHYNCY